MDTFKNISPYHQAAVAVGLGLLSMLGCLIFNQSLSLEPQKPWVFAITFLLFYVVTNVVFSLNASNAEKYWTQSVFSFLLALVALGGLAYLVSGLGINEAGSFKWLFTVVTISYIVFMSIVRAMKSIVEFAQKEEWNQPRERKRKKKK